MYGCQYCQPKYLLMLSGCASDLVCQTSYLAPPMRSQGWITTVGAEPRDAFNLPSLTQLLLGTDKQWGDPTSELIRYCCLPAYQSVPCHIPPPDLSDIIIGYIHIE